jgi:hypothetical protein
LKSIEYKIALSISIIRNKPNDLTLAEFLQLLRANFCQSYELQSEQIKNLKLNLIEARKEVFYLRNGQTLLNTKENSCKEPSSSSCFSSTSYLASNESSKVKVRENIRESVHLQEKWTSLQQSLKSNIEFMSNVAKLKRLDKDTIKLNDADRDVILECLEVLFEQINMFLFQPSKCQSQPLFEIAFPYDSILHSVQLFLNIYEIEWFYYLRNKLIHKIVQFIDDLSKFIIQADKKVRALNILNTLAFHFYF